MHPDDEPEPPELDVVVVVLGVPLVLPPVGPAGVVVVVGVVGFELEAHMMAPLTHFVPDDTAPILTKLPSTQTDQPSPSDEH